MTLTYKVDWIKDLAPKDGTDSFGMYLVNANEKKRIRVMNVNYFYEMREKNNVPAHQTDLAFLCGDPAFQQLVNMGGFHIEFALEKMSPKKEGRQRAEFPASAFDQGTTKQL